MPSPAAKGPWPAPRATLPRNGSAASRLAVSRPGAASTTPALNSAGATSPRPHPALPWHRQRAQRRGCVNEPQCVRNEATVASPEPQRRPAVHTPAGGHERSRPWQHQCHLSTGTSPCLSPSMGRNLIVRGSLFVGDLAPRGDMHASDAFESALLEPCPAWSQGRNRCRLTARALGLLREAVDARQAEPKQHAPWSAARGLVRHDIDHGPWRILRLATTWQPGAVGSMREGERK